jgi:hypothetical protein
MVRIRNVGADEDEATGGKGKDECEPGFGVDGKESTEYGVDGWVWARSWAYVDRRRGLEGVNDGVSRSSCGGRWGEDSFACGC